MMTYLTWCSIFVTVASCIFMMLETPTDRLMEIESFQAMEYIFVIFMSIEMTLKVHIFLSLILLAVNVEANTGQD